MTRWSSLLILIFAVSLQAEELPTEVLPTDVIPDWTFARDEHGRSCFFRPKEHPKARMHSLVEDGQTVWVMSGVDDDSRMTCGNGRRFRINEKKTRFLRGDFGLKEIVQHYAQASCSVKDKGVTRPLQDAEAEKITRCFLLVDARRDIYALIKLYLEHKLQIPMEHGVPMHIACGQEILLNEDKEVKCPWTFLKLGIDSSLHDIVVLRKGDITIPSKNGEYSFTGAGSNASDYVLAPDFDGKIDVRGHSKVFHLPHHSCKADHFRGCWNVTNQ